MQVSTTLFQTRLQPVHVEDVGEGVARVLLRAPAAERIYELAGPRVYTYAELLRTLAAGMGAATQIRDQAFQHAHTAFGTCRQLRGNAKPLDRGPPSRKIVLSNQPDRLAPELVEGPPTPAPGHFGMRRIRIENRWIAIYILACAIITLAAAAFMPDYTGRDISTEYDEGARTADML